MARDLAQYRRQRAQTKSLVLGHRDVVLAVLAPSYGEQLFTDEVEADHLGRLPLVEVAMHGVSDLRMQIGDVVGLREDGSAEGPRGEAALGRFFDEENELAHDEFEPSMPILAWLAASANVAGGSDA